MSDLAPFVAASIRDQVVLELQKEIAELRDGLERKATEKQEALVRDALDGLSNSLCIAITGPTNPHEGGEDTAVANPVVYAVNRLDGTRRGVDLTDETGIVKINTCTLGDLRRAEIHANGDRGHPIRDCPIDFSLVISRVDETRETFDSIQDVPAPGSDYNLGWFTVHVMSSNIGYFNFELSSSSVPNDRLFDFTGWSLKDRKEYLANPKPSLEVKREVSIDDIISFFRCRYSCLVQRS